MTIKTQTHTAYHEDYDEAEALKDLIVASNAAIDYSFKQTCMGIDDLSSFSININGKSISFIVGGPQIGGLRKFVEYLASRHNYTVDFDKEEVTR